MPNFGCSTDMFAYIMLMVSLLTASPLFPDVILITLDGVRWQEVFQGTDPQRDGGHHLTPQRLLPNLYNYFVEQGVAVGRDTPIIASGPRFVSLPGYMEITRGHPSTDCQTNSCNPVIDQSVFDLFNYPLVAPFDGLDVKVPLAQTESDLIYFIKNKNPIDISFLKEYIFTPFSLDFINRLI